MKGKPLIRQRVIELLDHVMRTTNASQHAAAKAIDLDPSMAKKLRDGERDSIGTVQIDRILAATRLPATYFSAPAIPADTLDRALAGERVELDSESYTAVEAYLSPDAAAERPPVSAEHAAELRRFRNSGEVTLAMVAGLHRGMIDRDRGKAIVSKAEPLTTGQVPEGRRKVGPARRS